MNRRDKVDMVHGSRDHVRPGMAIGGDRAHQVDVVHKPAAQQVAQRIGVVGQDQSVISDRESEILRGGSGESPDSIV